MLRDEAVARIQQKLGFRSDRSAEIVTALQDAQIRAELAAFLPWFLITEIASATTTSGEERCPVPDDFIREYEDEALWYFNSGASDPEDQWTELGKENLDFLRTEGSFGGSGPPQAYSLDGLNFRIFPTPDAAYPLRLVYYARDTVLSTNIENNWLKYYPFWLIGDAGMDIAQDLRDRDAINWFTEKKDEARAQAIIDTTARAMANRRMVVGGLD